MARFVNYDELIEEIKTLSTDEQEHLLLFVKHKIKDKPLKNTKAKNLSLEIELPLHSKTNQTEYENLSDKAKYAGFYSEAIFWLIKSLSKGYWDSENTPDSDDLFQNLYFITDIGIELSAKCADSIDRAEMLHSRKDKESETDKQSEGK